MMTITPTTAWLTNEDLKKTKYKDGLGTDRLKFMKHPVILPDDKGFGRVYELDRLLEWKKACGDRGAVFCNPVTKNPIDLDAIDPVRYAGFKTYNETVEMLKKNHRWVHPVEEAGVPTVATGMKQPNPLLNAADRKVIEDVKKHKQMISALKKNAEDSRKPTRAAWVIKRQEIKEKWAIEREQAEYQIALLDESYRNVINEIDAYDDEAQADFFTRSDALANADSDDDVAEEDAAAAPRAAKRLKLKKLLTDEDKQQLNAYFITRTDPENAILDCVATTMQFSRFAGISDTGFREAKTLLDLFCCEFTVPFDDDDAGIETSPLIKLSCCDFTSADPKRSSRMSYIFKWRSLHSLAMEFVQAKTALGVRRMVGRDALDDSFRTFFNLKNISTARFSSTAIANALENTGCVEKEHRGVIGICYNFRSLP